MIRPSDEQPKQGSGAFEDVVTVELSDLDRRFCALLRVSEPAATADAAQLGLVWLGSEPITGEDGVAFETLRPLGLWRCRFDDPRMTLEAELEAATSPIDFDDPAIEGLIRATGMRRYEQLCRVRGELRLQGRRVEIGGVGRRTHAWGEPSGSRFRSLYAISGDRSVTITAVQPAEGEPHGGELIAAHLFRAEAPPALFADARLSTIYDGAGRPRTAGAELYLEGEEYPRRISGEAICQAQDPSAAVRAACFCWSVDGQPGQGGYQLVSR